MPTSQPTAQLVRAERQGSLAQDCRHGTWWYREWVAAVLIGVFAAVLSAWCHRAGDVSGAEGFACQLATYSWDEILVRTVRDVHPPLYYIVLRTAAQLGGIDPMTAGRVLALGFRFLSIVLTFSLLRCAEHLDDVGSGPAVVGRVRLGTILLMAIAGDQIDLGASIRMYGLVQVLCLSSTLFFVRIVLGTPQRRIFLAGYALCVALACYAHYFAVFAAIGHLVFLAVVTTLRGPKTFPQGAAAATGTAIGSAAVLFSPWLPVVHSQAANAHRDFWNTSGGVVSGFAVNLAHYLAGIPSGIPVATAGGLACLTAGIVLACRRGSVTCWLFATLGLVPVVLLACCGATLGHAIWEIRFLAPFQFGVLATVAYCALGRQSLRHACIGGACAVPIIASGIAVIWNAPAAPSSLNSGVQFILARLVPGDALIAVYVKDAYRAAAMLRHVQSGIVPGISWRRYRARRWEDMLASALDSSQAIDNFPRPAFRRVWVIGNSTGAYIPQGAERFVQVLSRQWGRGETACSVELYVEPPLAAHAPLIAQKPGATAG